MKTAYLKAALIPASTEKVRYYLMGVYMDPAGFAVATDGHRAFVARIEPFDGEGYIIPADAVKRALTGYKDAEIEVTRERVGAVQYVPVDGTYPDWRRIIPADMTGVIAQFNPAYVADAGKIGKLLGAERLTAHIHHNGDGPAGVTFPGCEDAFMVLMPIRADYHDSDAVWNERKGIAV